MKKDVIRRQVQRPEDEMLYAERVYTAHSVIKCINGTDLLPVYHHKMQMKMLLPFVRTMLPALVLVAGTGFVGLIKIV